MRYTKDEIQAADNTEIISVLRQMGEPYKRVGSYYETIAHDSLRIRGNRYNWYSKGTYGKTIGFVMDYFGMGFPHAMSSILGNTTKNGFKLNTSTIIADDDGFNMKNIEIPHHATWSAENLREVVEKKRAIAYLCSSRGLQYDLVTWLIRHNLVGQDDCGCILFKALNESGDVVGAERRSMNFDSKFRQTVLGTNTNYGVNIKGANTRNAFFFESAIDMFSFFELYNKKLTDSILVSMRGLKPGLIDATLSRNGIDQGNSYLCVDDDDAGNNFVIRTRQKYPDIRSITVGDGHKDWNEKLVAWKNARKIELENLETA